MRWSPGFWTPIQREVWTEPSWLMNDTQALLVWTFCATPRFGTTMRPRAGIVRAALGRVDRAEDLHVRRHRLEGAVGGRVDRQAEAVADEERLRCLCGGCCASSAPRGDAERQRPNGG